jgi:hypothetical protein
VVLTVLTALALIGAIVAVVWALATGHSPF